MGEAANASAAFVTNETGSASMGTGPTSFRSTGSIGIGSPTILLAPCRYNSSYSSFAGADATEIGIDGSTLFIPILSFTP
jgi:hypothetical protein